MLNDFKAFIAQGNALDLAVGVIIGGAFATITKSLTEDLLMPIVSAIFGGVNYANKFILLGKVPAGVSATDYAALKAAAVPMLGYGAFIIGGAFATITKSLTEDLLMPIVSAIFGGVNYANKFILLGKVPAGVSATDYAALKAAAVPMLGYGAFITAIINFLILAFVIFLVVRWVNKLMKTKIAEGGPTQVDLLVEIRDELRKK